MTTDIEIVEPSSSNLPVTIIVCCYNAEATIAETLRTLQEQTYSPAEILIIDDGSTDCSVKIVQHEVQNDTRIRLIENSTNRGTAYSRQKGLREARTDIVMFFDADDLAEPCMLEAQMSALETDNRLLGVGCYAVYFRDGVYQLDLGVQRVGPTSQKVFFEQYRRNKLLFMPGITLFRRQDALLVGGYRQQIMPNPEGIRYEDFAEDLDLWCRMSDLGAEGRYFVTIPEPLFRYRKPAESLSTKNIKYMQLKMRWIKDCLVRRRSGQPERSLADFLASRTLLDRFNDRRSDLAASFYKRAAFFYSSRSYAKLGFCLLFASVLSPKLIVQKIKTQSVRR